ncbi:DUF1285 domain-containing protein [Hyphomicrobiales bacterium]|jgi:hypothetical protein|nr:DUF1285 domain-containing protein [Hyphomicrobiales bacterium]MDC0139265.1 DUF1285 domain-containing protein [Hyphomicrobiales bacterium]MDC3272323.1 DUF1285 domain-containing protein [Hyphomicrobiales bacterium]|tara:strand:+ start:1426 stop:1956 length:531 start_codon:yes stop_codon:yes gene_type:complete
MKIERLFKEIGLGEVNTESINEKFLIDRNGKWFFEGSEIKRQPMINLFSRFLKLEADQKYYIITPYEKVLVKVIDVPFVIKSIKAVGAGKNQLLTVITNVDHEIIVGKKYPIRFAINPTNNGVTPYVKVKDNLEAVFSRMQTLEIIDLCINFKKSSENTMGLWSDNFFVALETDNF